MASVDSTIAVAGMCVFLTGAAFLFCVYLLPRWLLRLVEWHSHPSVLWRVRTSARVCSLTVDDAPSPSTSAILDVLKEFNVRATFFVISGNVPGNEEVLKRIVNEGHVLGNHLTEDRASILDELHVFEQKLQECDRVLGEFQQLQDTLQPQQILLEEKKGAAVVQPVAEGSHEASTTVVRHKLKWMRPASGWFTTPMREITARHGYRICLGSVYPHDAQIRNETINSMHLKARTDCGSVIIVHDRSWTIGVLKAALPVLTHKFSFVSLDELVAYRNQEKSAI